MTELQELVKIRRLLKRLLLRTAMDEKDEKEIKKI